MKIHPIALLIASPTFASSSSTIERKRKDVTLDSDDSTVNLLQQAIRESQLLKEALREQQSTEHRALEEALQEQQSAAASRSLQDTNESGSPTYYPTFYISSPEEIYGDSWWADLPKDIKRAFKVLGWDQVSWDTGINPPSENMSWDELTLAMQGAAGVIGYTQETWDLEEDVSDSIEDYAWISLPEYAKEAAIILGWNEDLWDYGGTAWSDEMLWNELSSDAQEAAVVLGYDEASWNAGVPAKDELAEEENTVSIEESVEETTTSTVIPSTIMSTVEPSTEPDTTEAPVNNDDEVTITETTDANNGEDVTTTEATMSKGDDKFPNEDNSNSKEDDKFVKDESTLFAGEQSMSIPLLDMSMVESYDELSMSMSMTATDDDLSSIESDSNDKIFVDTVDDDVVDDDQLSMSMSMSIPEDDEALSKEEFDNSR